MTHRSRISTYLLGFIAACHALAIPSDEAIAQAARVQAVITGTVTDITGEPVPYAHVSAAGVGLHAVTGKTGAFRLGLSIGDTPIALSIRRIGFKPHDTTLVGGNVGLGPVTIVLSKAVATMDTVRIRARAGSYDEYLDRSGYYRRSALRIDGSFIPYEAIEKRNATELSAVLRDVNGVRVVSRQGRAGKGNFVLGRGGLCALGVVIDGQRVEISVPPLESFQPRITSMMGGRAVSAIHQRSSAGAPTLDELIPPSMLAAIEVYPSAASVPNELQQHTYGCGLIVAWTRFSSK